MPARSHEKGREEQVYNILTPSTTVCENFRTCERVRWFADPLINLIIALVRRIGGSNGPPGFPRIIRLKSGGLQTKHLVPYQYPNTWIGILFRSYIYHGLGAKVRLKPIFCSPHEKRALRQSPLHQFISSQRQVTSSQSLASVHAAPRRQ